MANALDVQVGGSHYKGLAIQPIEFSEKNGLSATQHSVIKYITRRKGSLEDRLRDADKAIHCIELHKQSLIEDWQRERDPVALRERAQQLLNDAQALEAENVAKAIPAKKPR